MDALKELETFEQAGQVAWAAYEQGLKEARGAAWFAYISSRAPYISVGSKHPDPQVIRRMHDFLGGTIVNNQTHVLNGREAARLSVVAEHMRPCERKTVITLLSAFATTVGVEGKADEGSRLMRELEPYAEAIGPTSLLVTWGNPDLLNPEGE
jgi:hypothetical protein